MIFKLLPIIVLIQTARSAPQFLTFENGKIGVNFGGYHAEAGLGGLLTGNAAHGGLSASAGTPFGQSAGAGLGGSLDGRTAGGLYAGASAGHGVGASAALGGGLDANGMSLGGIGAESHAGGVSKKVVKVSGTQPESVKTVTYVDEKPPSIDATYNNGFSATSSLNAQSSINGGINGQSSIASTLNAQSPLGSVDAQSAVQSSIETGPHKTVHVQKLKKHLHHRHHLWPSHSNANKRVESGFNVHKEVNVAAPVQTQSAYAGSNVYAGYSGGVQSGLNVQKEVSVAATPVQTGFYAGGNSNANFGYSGGYDSQAGAKFINDIFNIPIATLQAVNRLVSNKVASGGGNIDIQKTITVNHS